jgi:hypothetical protein
MKRVMWLLTAALALSILSVPWMFVEIEATFTSGVPEGSTVSLTSDVSIDGSVTREMEVTQSTPFIEWMADRQDANLTVVGQEPDQESGTQAEGGLTRGTVVGGLIVVSAITLSVLSLRGSIRGAENTTRFALGVWAIGLFLLTVAVPWAWASAITDQIDQGESPWVGQGPDAKFAHINHSEKMSLAFNGIRIDHSGTMWDLLLIDDQNRSAAAISPPEGEEVRQRALIGWEGTIRLDYGPAIWIWISAMIPLAVTFTWERTEHTSKVSPDCSDE